MKHISRTLIVSVLILFAFTTLARSEPTISDSSFVDIEAAMPDCGQHIAEVVIDQVVYKNVSDIIAGFRIERPSPNGLYSLYRIRTSSYEHLSKVEQYSVLSDLVSKGAQLIITYQICGSGGFIYVENIYKASVFND